MTYAIVQLTVTAPETFAEYAAMAGPALAKYGAKPVAMSTEPKQLEGTAPLPGRAVILSFPDTEAAMGWISDPDLQEIHALRRASGDSNIMLLV